ncbi:MAG: DUF1223 domain-containing protein [Sphingomicrobium sp.]
MIKWPFPLLAVVGAGAWLWTTYAAGVATPASTAPLAKLAPTGHRPILVELYQSQGCSSCPPANANLNLIADRPDVVALSFAVTYWDQYGWKDGFAQPQFTARQWDYARFNHRDNVATPQMWIDGTRTIVGGNSREVAQTIARGGRDSGPNIRIAGATAEIGSGKAPTGGADVWLAEYDPRTLDVAIRAGENGGRTLPHRNIVRRLQRIGHWAGPVQQLKLPPAIPGMRRAIFLQAGNGGPVLAAAAR